MTLGVLSWSRDLDAERPPGPRGWGHALSLIAVRLGAGGIVWQPSPGTRRRCDIAWQPGRRALAAAIRGRRLVYICWGVPEGQPRGAGARLRRARLAAILRGARLVLCNDPVTEARLRSDFGVAALRVPWPVDTAYFAEGLPAAPRPEVLIPGSNARDESLARALAAGGQRVIRVSEAPSVADWHRANPQDGLSLFQSIPFAELRGLYQSCHAVLLPLRETDHAAGQTAALEALASGARLLVSEGFTASIVADYPGVAVVPRSAGAEAWQRLLAAPAPPPAEAVTGPILDHATERAAAAIADAIRAALPELAA